MKKLMLIFATSAFAIFAGTNTSGANPVCPGENILRSINSSQKTKVIFVNESTTPEDSFIIYWLDFEGKRVKYGQVFPGETHHQSTFLGHPWVITSPIPGGGEDCIDLYLPRRDGETISLGGNANNSEVNTAESEYFPWPAGSWGGKVRTGPGLNHPAIANLAEGESVTLTENTGIMMNGYPWYRIRFREDGRGYQWGGILCSGAKALPGLFQTCP